MQNEWLSDNLMSAFPFTDNVAASVALADAVVFWPAAVGPVSVPSLPAPSASAVSISDGTATVSVPKTVSYVRGEWTTVEYRNTAAYVRLTFCGAAELEYPRAGGTLVPFCTEVQAPGVEALGTQVLSLQDDITLEAGYNVQLRATATGFELSAVAGAGSGADPDGYAAELRSFGGATPDGNGYIAVTTPDCYIIRAAGDTLYLTNTCVPCKACEAYGEAYTTGVVAIYERAAALLQRFKLLKDKYDNLVTVALGLNTRSNRTKIVCELKKLREGAANFTFNLTNCTERKVTGVSVVTAWSPLASALGSNLECIGQLAWVRNEWDPSRNTPSTWSLSGASTSLTEPLAPKHSLRSGCVAAYRAEITRDPTTQKITTLKTGAGETISVSWTATVTYSTGPVDTLTGTESVQV